ncbi:MAG: hypothetical protein DLM64_10760 [Solirubrobacterales bacterium]|nr:MAG: hypothetical protein DLM64_10760 [Solirubrobacterales bacterium]
MSDCAKPAQIAISLLTHDQWTGSWTYARELIRELGKRPDSVRVEVLINEHGWRGLKDQVPDSVALVRARGYRVGRGRARKRLAMGAAALAPRRLELQLSADVELVHYPMTLNVPAVRRPTAMTLHDVQYHDLPHAFTPAQRRWRSVMYDRPARQATFVVTDSDHARARIIEVVGVLPERIATVHPGVDRARFTPQPSPQDPGLLAPLHLPGRFVYYPASLWAHKNHIGLLDALAACADRDLALVCTGATFGRRRWLMSAAAERGLGDRVRHLELVPDAVLPALYRAATALVFPSRYEGFGLPPLEAMASGCPVASSLRCSLEEVCGSAAVALDPDDAEQMAHAIGRVVGDEELRTRLRAAGSQQASEFSWARSADQLVSVYGKALGRELTARP